MWADAMRLLNAYGTLGHWKLAHALVGELGLSFEAAPELAYVDAIASVHLGDRDRVAELCRSLVERFDGTRNPDRAALAVRVCLLAPSDRQLPWGRVDDLAHRAPLVSRDYLRQSGLVGASLLCGGDARAGLARLTEASSRTDGFDNPHTLLFAGEAARRAGDARGTATWSARLGRALSGPWQARVRREPLGAWHVAEIEALRMALP